MAANIEKVLAAVTRHMYESACRLTPPYHAIRFLGVVQSQGGKATADQLQASGSLSIGFIALFLRGGDSLRLGVEYLVLQQPWRQIFAEAQLATARARLFQDGFPRRTTKVYLQAARANENSRKMRAKMWPMWRIVAAVEDA